jgi:carboxyl-terminal processing protease
VRDPVVRAPVESTRMFGTRDDKTLQAAVAVLTPESQRSATLAGLLRKLGKGLQSGTRTAAVPAPSVVAAVGAP